jgi:hypothetical protein
VSNVLNFGIHAKLRIVTHATNALATYLGISTNIHAAQQTPTSHERRLGACRRVSQSLMTDENDRKNQRGGFKIDASDRSWNQQKRQEPHP